MPTAHGKETGKHPQYMDAVPRAAGPEAAEQSKGGQQLGGLRMHLESR